MLTNSPPPALKNVHLHSNFCFVYFSRLKVHSKPLEIVYNAATLTRIKDFFTAPLSAQESISQLEGRIQDYTLSDKLGGMLGGGAKVRLGVVCTLSISHFPQTTSHRITSIKLDISAPHLILPEDFANRETSMVSMFVCT